jgi:glyoxylase-like metal-dependent hydrolase (beta-lactamase superfamily II)
MTPAGSHASRLGARLWKEVGDRVFVRRFQDFNLNVGLVGGAEAWLLIDTRASERQGRELAAEIRSITPAPLVVLDTHHHFDHAFGNAAFLPCDIWGQERCASRLSENIGTVLVTLSTAMPELAEEFGETHIVGPNRTFGTSAELDLGGRRVALRHLGRGHTDNDVVAIVSDAAVVFAGDLLEQGAPPSFEDSYPLDWPGTLERLLGQVTGPFVPGHGDVVDRAFAESQREEIAAIADLARQLDLEGRSIEDGLAGAPLPAATSRSALHRAFAQLGGQI